MIDSMGREQWRHIGGKPARHPGVSARLLHCPSARALSGYCRNLCIVSARVAAWNPAHGDFGCARKCREYNTTTRIYYEFWLNLHAKKCSHTPFANTSWRSFRLWSGSFCPLNLVRLFHNSFSTLPNATTCLNKCIRLQKKTNQ